MELQSLRDAFNKEYLDKFKVFYPETLFEPSWSNLQVGRCPLCSCLLKRPRYAKVFICKSKKHAKPFVIKEETFKKLGGISKEK